jgi:uncharacterized protein
VAALAYVDSSALVKLIVSEAETSALRRALRGYERAVTSALTSAEVLRAARRVDEHLVPRVRAVLRRVNVLEISAEVLEAAARIEPKDLRTLDAIHVASAMLLTSALDAFITYDVRQANAAALAGLGVVTPG